MMIVNLKKLRNSKGISQQQLASLLNVSQQSINKYENHNVEPDISILIAMAEYLDTTIDYLVGRSDCNSSGNGISKKEEKLIFNFRDLSPTEKQCITTIIDAFISSHIK